MQGCDSLKRFLRFEGFGVHVGERGWRNIFFVNFGVLSNDTVNLLDTDSLLQHVLGCLWCYASIFLASASHEMTALWSDDTPFKTRHWDTDPHSQCSKAFIVHPPFLEICSEGCEIRDLLLVLQHGQVISLLYWILSNSYL